MAKNKYTHPNALDAALDYIRDNVTTMIACSALPTNLTEATTTYALADKAITSANVQDCAAGDGASGSRKIQVDAQSDVDIDATGTASYIALVSGTELLHVGTCTDLSLTSGQKVNFPAWDIEFAPPTAEA